MRLARSGRGGGIQGRFGLQLLVALGCYFSLSAHAFLLPLGAVRTQRWVGVQTTSSTSGGLSSSIYAGRTRSRAAALAMSNTSGAF
jgi:hypothetical protein